ncbi:MAG: hypothetical protein IJQ91_07480 [Acidaminococcaceae bacterium]|nr:hypothetical protein [Acidaminococcaceae bacterium]
MDKIKEFIADNHLALLIGILLLVLICWLHADRHRNDPVYNDTNATVERLEKRINAVESGLDRMQKRHDEAQKTVESVGRGITTSTGLAIEINENAERTEERLNSAIERSQRIEKLISDIEKSNRKGAPGASPASLAK